MYWNRPNREIMAINSLKHPEKLYNSERIIVTELHLISSRIFLVT